jgi:hypothetical protein
LRKIQGTARLLGTLEIGQGEALACVEQSCMLTIHIVNLPADDSKVALSLPLVNVNYNGPKFHLNAAFSISSSTPKLPGLDGDLGIQSEI